MAAGWQGVLGRLAQVAVRQAPRVLAQLQRDQRQGGQRPAAGQGSSAPQGRHLEYAPQPDGRADPGEVVWTWVEYEEHDGRGKDRPVLVVGREGRVLLGLMLSSQSERDGQHGWLALGPGAWGTGRSGPAGSAWTGCWRSTRTASGARARCSTAGASSSSRARCDAAGAGARASGRCARCGP